MTTAKSQINSISRFDDFLQIYFIFARFCEFQKLFKKIKVKELLKEGSEGTDLNEGRFVLNIDVSKVLFIIDLSQVSIEWVLIGYIHYEISFELETENERDL
jgi:hypothetical protein